MPRFTYPIPWQIVRPDSTGPMRIRMVARMPIFVRNTVGDWTEIPVLVDTGASYSFLPTAYARYKNLPVPSSTSRMELLTANGVHPSVVRDADFTICFPRLPERSFELLWLLRDDLPLDAPALLGLHNTVDLLSILFDGTPRPDGLIGCMEFTTRVA